MAVEYLNGNEIRRALSRMFLGFPGSGTCKNPGERMAVYVEALHRIPSSFVVEACDYALRGKLLTQKDFPPTAADLSRLATELHTRTLPARGRKAYDGPILYSKEQRLRVIQGFKDLLLNLRSGNPIEPDMATNKVFKVREDKWSKEHEPGSSGS